MEIEAQIINEIGRISFHESLHDDSHGEAPLESLGNDIRSTEAHFNREKLQNEEIELYLTDDILTPSQEYNYQNHNHSDATVNASDQRESSSVKYIQLTAGLQHFDILKLIGKGAFGSVYVVKNRLNNEFYAMKVISKRLLRKKNNIAYMKSERDILTKIAHPFVVSLQYAFQTTSKLYLIMDFLGGGELFSHLRRHGIILEAQAKIYFAEMVLAIEFLHSIGVIHRDLKPENVLLRLNGHIAITDFGLAKEIGDGTTTRTLCGTSEYMAPEMLTRNGYGKAVDWWSLGALFYEMLVGKAPFTGKDQKELDRKILTEKLSLPAFLSSNAHSLLRGLIERDINKRLGAAKSTMFSIGGVAALKQHPFFAGLNWIDVLHGRVEAPFNMDEIFCRGKSSKANPTDNSSTPKAIDTMNSADANAFQITSQLETIDLLTLPFHDEFTSQTISYSILEDCYDTIHSALSSPGESKSPQFGMHTKSSTGFHTPLTNPQDIAKKKANDADEFAGFEYQANGPVLCSEELVKQFEQDLTVKLLKLQKKRNQKIKQIQNQELKQQQIQIQQLQQDLDGSKKLKKDTSCKRDGLIASGTQTPKSEEYLRRQEEIKLLQEEKLKKEKREKELREELEKQGNIYNLLRKDLIQMEKEVQVFEDLIENKEKYEKRIKNLKKKLREIEELESKVVQMSSIPGIDGKKIENPHEKISSTATSTSISKVSRTSSNKASNSKSSNQSKDKTSSTVAASSSSASSSGTTSGLTLEQLDKINKKSEITKELIELENMTVSSQTSMQSYVVKYQGKLKGYDAPLDGMNSSNQIPDNSQGQQSVDKNGKSLVMSGKISSHAESNDKGKDDLDVHEVVLRDMKYHVDDIRRHIQSTQDTLDTILSELGMKKRFSNSQNLSRPEDKDKDKDKIVGGSVAALASSGSKSAVNQPAAVSSGPKVATTSMSNASHRKDSGSWEEVAVSKKDKTNKK